MRVFAITLLTLLVTLGSTVDVAAQRDDRRGRSRAELEQRFRAQMNRLVQERLGLDDAQAQALNTLIEPFDARRRELGRAQFQTRRRVDEMTDRDDADPEEARALVERLVELRRQESELFAEEQAALMQVLAPIQILELYEIREQLAERIRALRDRDDDDGRRRRRRGGDDGRDGPRSERNFPESAGDVDVVRGVGLLV